MAPVPSWVRCCAVAASGWSSQEAGQERVLGGRLGCRQLCPQPRPPLQGFLCLCCGTFRGGTRLLGALSSGLCLFPAPRSQHRSSLPGGAGLGPTARPSCQVSPCCSGEPLLRLFLMFHRSSVPAPGREGLQARNDSEPEPSGTGHLPEGKGISRGEDKTPGTGAQ